MSECAGAADLEAVGRLFVLEGSFVSGERYGSGHINDTFVVTYESAGHRRRYLQQRINDHVFSDPAAVMGNIAAVTGHIRARVASEGASDLDRRVLTLVPARAGADSAVDDEGRFWRTYVFVEGTRTLDIVESEAQAFETARAFGEFQRQLSDYDGPRLAETIPGFHDTPRRLATFEHSLRRDPVGRSSEAAREVDSLRARAGKAGALQSLHAQGGVPERIVHNDTKLNNLLLDRVSGGAVCVVDLDTVMPGLALHDFGYMVRSSAVRTSEDEPDLARVRLDPGLFEALARGYLSAAGSFLTPAERESLVTAAEVIVLEQSLRFLTDFLEGDVYYRTERKTHNLDRCRTQLRLLASLEEQGDRLRRRVEEIAREVTA